MLIKNKLLFQHLELLPLTILGVKHCPLLFLHGLLAGHLEDDLDLGPPVNKSLKNSTTGTAFGSHLNGTPGTSTRGPLYVPSGTFGDVLLLALLEDDPEVADDDEDEAAPDGLLAA